MENTQLLGANGLSASYTYRLSLSFVHEDRDLAYIPERLVLTVHRIWKKGDEYVARMARKPAFPDASRPVVFSFRKKTR